MAITQAVLNTQSQVTSFTSAKLCNQHTLCTLQLKTDLGVANQAVLDTQSQVTSLQQQKASLMAEAEKAAQHRQTLEEQLGEQHRHLQQACPFPV